MAKIITQIKSFIKRTDKILLLLCMMLSAIGITAVSSATLSGDEKLSRTATVMLIAVSAGIVAALIISVIDYNFIIRMWPIIGAVCLLLMILLFFIGVGPSSRPDAKTWLVLGSTGLYFQPSELLKIGFIITFSVHIDTVRDKINSIKHLLLLCIHAAVPVLLVAASGDMGSALIFLIIFAVMLFAAGVQLRYFLLGFAALGAAIPFAWKFVLKDLQKNRIYALFSPEEYPDIIYQQQQGLGAMRNGGFFGMGLYKGAYTHQPGMLPEGENDMIFAVIGEEFGLVGCLAVIVLFIFLTIKIMQTAKNSKDGTVNLVCGGVAAMIAGQVIVNIGMCMKLLPVIGITLPFLSSGGSSNLCIYIAIGLIMSIRRYNLETNIVDFKLKNISTPFN